MGYSMSNRLIDAIENFVVDKNSETENIMEKMLAEEIFEAFKYGTFYGYFKEGERNITFETPHLKKQTFKLIYNVCDDKKEDNAQKLPDYVEWFNYEPKDFSEAVAITYNDLKKKIKTAINAIPISPRTRIKNLYQDNSILDKLSGDKAIRHNYIRTNAAINMLNKLFSKEHAAYNKNKTTVKSGIRKVFLNQKFCSSSALFEFIKANFNKIYERLKDSEEETVVWALTNANYSDEDIVKWIENQFGNSIKKNDIKKIKDKIFERIKSDLKDSFQQKLNVKYNLKKLFKYQVFSNMEDIETFISETFISEKPFYSRVLHIINHQFENFQIACWALFNAGYDEDSIIIWIKNIFSKTINGKQIKDYKNCITTRLEEYLQVYFQVDDNPVPLIEITEQNSGEVHKKNVSDIDMAKRMKNLFPMGIINEVEDVVNTYLSDPVSVVKSFGEDMTEEFFNLQKEAFFWKPEDKSFNGKQLDAKRSMYIAFFYAWLRTCSHIPQGEIAKEIGVHGANVSRWLKSPHSMLAEYFPSTLFYSDKGIYPVCFDRQTHEITGMNVEKSRCYQGPFNHKYNEIVKKKESLWAVYKLLWSGDRLDYFVERTSYNKAELETHEIINYEICYKVIYIDDLKTSDISRDLFVYIKSIKEVTNA